MGRWGGGEEEGRVDCHAYSHVRSTEGRPTVRQDLVVLFTQQSFSCDSFVITRFVERAIARFNSLTSASGVGPL